MYRLMYTRALLQSEDHSVGSKRYLLGLEGRAESFASLETRLDSIDATMGLQEIHVATREESGVLCFPSR